MAALCDRGQQARESFRVFEADRPGDFAQASNEQEEPAMEILLTMVGRLGSSPDLSRSCSASGACPSLNAKHDGRHYAPREIDRMDDPRKHREDLDALL